MADSEHDTDLLDAYMLGLHDGHSQATQNATISDTQRFLWLLKNCKLPPGITSEPGAARSMIDHFIQTGKKDSKALNPQETPC